MKKREVDKKSNKPQKTRFWSFLKWMIFLIVVFFSALFFATSFGFANYQMFVVKSGSMEPAIGAGDLIVVKEKPDYEVGDIITFETHEGNDMTTHRIVELGGGERAMTSYIVKGDANKAPDPEPVMKYLVAGKTQFSIPYLGHLVSFLKTPFGLIAFIIVPATIIVYEEVGSIRNEVVKIREKKRAKKEKKDD